MKIEVGQIVGWGSDLPYGDHLYSEGRVMARHGEFLVILNEGLLESTPHAMPFVIRKDDHVWLVEGKNGCLSAATVMTAAGATTQSDGPVS